MMFKGISATALFFIVLCHGQTDNAEQYCKDFKRNPDIGSDVDDYFLHQALKEGLADNFKNLYNIQKADLKHKSNSKIACLSVMFELQCIPNDGNCSLLVKANDADTECSINVNGTKTVFLWSSFDTSSLFGSLLLTYTVYDLRAFGFGWEDDCELYQTPINISISIDKIPCVTKDELCTALQYITTLLPAYSIAQNISTQTEEVGIGYAHPQREYQINSTDAIVFLIAFGIMVLSKVIIITLVTTHYDTASELMRWKNSPFYYFFWGCHCTTFCVLIVGNSIYIAWAQENKVILVVPCLSAFLDFVGAFVLFGMIIKSYFQGELLPVPLTACFQSCCKSSRPLEYILNIAAFFFTFFFISSLLQIFPNLLISYYAFPSRTLIHIGFFQVSFVCLVVVFGGLIFLLERLSWLIHIKVHGKIPEELNSKAFIDEYINSQTSVGSPSPNSSSNPTAEQASVSDRQHETRGNIQESPSVYGAVKNSKHNDEIPPFSDISGGASVAIVNQQPKLELNSASTESKEQFQNIEYSNKAELKKPIRTLCIMSFQILTALLLIVALFLLIIVIGIIVSTDAADMDSIQGILTLLPTIVVDIVIVLTRKKFFDNKVDLKNQLARVVESGPKETAETNDSHNETTQLLPKQC